MASASTRNRRIDAMDSFTSQILAKIEETGVSRTELARQAGVTRAYLYRVLDGTQVPSMVVADKIAKALGLVITTTPVAG